MTGEETLNYFADFQVVLFWHVNVTTLKGRRRCTSQSVVAASTVCGPLFCSCMMTSIVLQLHDDIEHALQSCRRSCSDPDICYALIPC